MPAQMFYGPIELFNKPGYRLSYGYAVSHEAPDGTLVSVIWTDETCPEMCPGHQRFAALRHAVKLLEDGSLWPDQVTVTCWGGGAGTAAMTGDKAEESYHTEYTEELQDPAYWERLSAESASDYDYA